MYSRQQATQLKQEFWTAFGQYMAPILSADGERVNWMNYKTSEKDIYFRMNADNKKASIAITLTHKDTGLQALYFEQFEQLKHLLHNALDEEWTWLLHTHDEHGKIISTIYKQAEGVNIFNQADWPEIITFFKPRIIALDAFWATARYAFEALR
ncbi:DUF4268 domain-containing protein [Foetidibacter luteolus]|uniref:DUF4268 domain-containing protein n=1 Tax=Foetidibacter luteolus TaxID=2608880 RepID=UPI00129BDDC9|nr:DUF4268 domain-containing protein [Foetidibacter luteolus]